MRSESRQNEGKSDDSKDAMDEQPDGLGVVDSIESADSGNQAKYRADVTEHCGYVLQRGVIGEQLPGEYER